MGPFTRLFGTLVCFALTVLFFYWGHSFLPAYLGCAFWAFMTIYIRFIYKDPPDDQNDQKKP